MQTNYIDIKITTWERYWFPNDTNMQEIKEKIKKGYKPWDIAESSVGEVVEDVSEVMTIEENGGLPTLEIYQDCEVIYNNVVGDIENDESYI